MTAGGRVPPHLPTACPPDWTPPILHLTDIGVKLDSLYYGGRNMKAVISQFVLKERSGVEIVSADRADGFQ